MPFILEGLVTTLNVDQSVKISPMGAIIDETMSQVILRPFQTSQTFQNLQRARQGVFHVTDDVELLAKAAVQQAPPARLIPAICVTGSVLADACRWYELQVRQLEVNDERTHIECAVVHQGRLRDFLGFNRAKHAVVEAAILATRLAILPREQILAEFERLAVLVDKTAGPQELRAFRFLQEYIK